MESRTLISVEEYLRTVYRPDCDYVDGEVQERNLGEWDHSSLQSAVLVYLWTHYRDIGLRPVTEQRVQVSATRFRVPDVCAVVGEPGEQVLQKPPFLCVEVLSPEDRMSRIRDRVDDYLNMGVPHVWVLDPQRKAAYSITPAEGWREEKQTLRTANPVLEMPLSTVFS